MPRIQHGHRAPAPSSLLSAPLLLHKYVSGPTPGCSECVRARAAAVSGPGQARGCKVALRGQAGTSKSREGREAPLPSSVAVASSLLRPVSCARSAPPAGGHAGAVLWEMGGRSGHGEQCAAAPPPRLPPGRRRPPLIPGFGHKAAPFRAALLPRTLLFRPPLPTRMSSRSRPKSNRTACGMPPSRQC